MTDYLKLTAASAIDRQRPAHALAGAAWSAAGDTVPGASTGFDGRNNAFSASPSGKEGHVREFRSTAEFMRSRLRISLAEARRRLALAAAVLPGTAPLGQVLPPAYPRLAAACADAALAESGVDVIAHALEEALPRLEPQALEAMEKQLTDIGSRQDHDFLVRTAKHWTTLLNQDQPPTEEELARFQGIFPGRRRNGLNHFHIYCTDEQHEALTTLINSAANPRLTGREHQTPGSSTHGAEETGAPETGRVGTGGAPTGHAGNRGAHGSPVSGTGFARTGTACPDGPTVPGITTDADITCPADDTSETGNSAPATAAQEPSADAGVMGRLPRPTRPQLLLEGLLAAVRVALASGGLPDAGGLRPQVMITISHKELLKGLMSPAGTLGRRNCGNAPDRPDAPDSPHPPDPPNSPNSPNSPDNKPSDDGFPSPGIASFAGPIDTGAVRRIACDADLIPVVLGSKGQVLDLGRAARLFPPHLRKALHARDRGCAFPGCTVPGPWTEAHHVTFWEQGGDTSIGNGVLLCSFHHHIIHQGNWQISMRSGIPWFRPPGYVDPDRKPLRNTYFHPGAPASDNHPGGT